MCSQCDQTPRSSPLTLAELEVLCVCVRPQVLLFGGDSSDAFTAKISDFGLATGIATTTFGAASAVGGGTTAYKAPEVFNNKSTTASDVYAFAVVCWELLSGDRPWAGLADAAILGAVFLNGERPPMPSAPPISSSHTPPSLDVFALLSSLVLRCWQQEGDSRPKFALIARQLELAVSQMSRSSGRLGGSMRPQINLLTAIDVFISFRFAEVAHSRARTTAQRGMPRLLLRFLAAFWACCALTAESRSVSPLVNKAHREALMIKAALEALGLVVFLSNVSPGGDLQDVISEALGMCKFAIILATKTYGAKTNGLFDTSNEMNFIISQQKPFYLVRMIPFDENWAEMRTTVAFPPSIMQKVRAPQWATPRATLHHAVLLTCGIVSYVCCGDGSSGSQVMATRCRWIWCPRCATSSAFSA